MGLLDDSKLKKVPQGNGVYAVKVELPGPALTNAQGVFQTEVEQVEADRDLLVLFHIEQRKNALSQSATLDAMETAGTITADEKARLTAILG